MLITPCHPRAIVTYRERFFQRAAPKEWDNIPVVIRVSPSLTVFQSRFNFFLICMYHVVNYFTVHIKIFIVFYLITIYLFFYI